ncbi:accessory Sec system protein Asp2, partial [Streptococcus pneumoniae]|nr:accessory Sec system protein Asp2 [Streptococcus pneumoniae]
LPEDLEWFFCKPENIQNFLKLEEEKLLAEFLKDMTKQDNLIEKPKIHIHFNAIVITDYLEEIQLEPLIDTIEAYSLFCSAELDLSSDSPNGIFRRKIIRKLEKSKDISTCINFLYQVLFSSQYGAKLKIPEIDINPNFRGMVQRNGHVNTQFTGDFGEDFQQLFTYRYNLSSFPVALELWQEYEKVKGNCHIQLVITPMRRG